ncbi:MAG TPA: cbb3-type cytochrome oxidase assembly protein CcoS [Gemmataceae bacterium]|jgi:cbb3-type cytochrome oxidase maturation protein|nr:cbb3-type cytochrome oxidase assembly protein CcoS [Gemmataceae bacterium]
MTAADVLIHVPLILSLVLFGGAAVLALAWAVEKGQFRNFQRAAESIFDIDEPIGRPTDRTLPSRGDPS